MNFLQELLSVIEMKTSWGKNELLREITRLMAKHYGELK